MAKKKTPDNPTAPIPPPRRRTSTKKPQQSAAAHETAAVTAPITIPDAPVPGNGGAPEPTRAEIAEAAYYRHLKRGGAHGDEFSDWIEAERELKQRHSR